MWATLNDTRLYYEEAGAGAPVLLLHGFSFDTRLWDETFAALAPHYHVIRYDLRGFGQSAWPTGPYSHVEDACALLTHLGFDAAHVVGLSLGGSIAIDLAITHPERVRSLTVVDGILSGFVWTKDWKPVNATARTVGLAEAKTLWLEDELFQPALAVPAAAARVRQMVADYSGWHWVNRDPARAIDPPALQRLETLAAPTLVFIGQHDAPDFHRIADALEHHVPRAMKIYMEGVGHVPPLEAPERFNERLLSFLAQAR